MLVQPILQTTCLPGSSINLKFLIEIPPRAEDAATAFQLGLGHTGADPAAVSAYRWSLAVHWVRPEMVVEVAMSSGRLTVC
jgi:hypothetical protein